MSNKIIESFDGKIERGCTVYIQDMNISYRLYDDSIYITELQNALKRGRICESVVIKSKFYNNTFHPEVFGDFKKLLETPAMALLHDNFYDEYEFYNRQLPSNCIYTPFYQEKNFKKVDLKKVKITLGDLKKMLLNGQIKQVIAKYDNNDLKLKAGTLIEYMWFCKELVEEPSGWWCKRIEKDDDGRLYIECTCHYYRSYKCMIESKL